MRTFVNQSCTASGSQDKTIPFELAVSLRDPIFPPPESGPTLTLLLRTQLTAVFTKIPFPGAGGLERTIAKRAILSG